MTNETLYDAITDISDGLIEEAENLSFRRRPKPLRRMAIAAAAAIVVGLGAGVLTGNLRLPGIGAGAGGGGNGGGEDGYSYMHYVGPVLPLTAADGAEGVTAARHVDYDFSPYRTRTERFDFEGETRSYDAWDTETVVTDAYTLTNTTDADKTLTLLYPAPLRFNDPIDRLPVIAVDGGRVAAALRAAPYSGGFSDAWGGTDPGARLNLAEIGDWQGYVDLLSDGSYQAAAFAPYPELTMPVTVYKVDDYVVAPTDAVNPSLQFAFRLDPARTRVMTYNSNGGSNDRESGECSRIIGGLGDDVRAPEPMYILVYGDDLDGYTLQGYANMGGNPGTEIDVTATVTRYETTMDAFLHQVVDEWFSRDGAFGYSYGDCRDTVAGAATREMLYGAAAELLASWGVFSDDPAERYEMGMLEDVMEAYSMGRVMYLAFDVTVPAQGSVGVTAVMHKDNSTDFVGKKRNVDGYDLATRLGSTLIFTQQRASVQNTSEIELLANNFGFDPANNITEVLLDESTEHFWMQVAKKQ